MGMTLVSKTQQTTTGSPVIAVWKWLVGPLHHRVVHALRQAAERHDPVGVAKLLDPDVAVVVDSGDIEHPTIRVVRGRYDAAVLLLHGLTSRPPFDLAVRSINGQAGLTLSHGGRVTAALNIDFTAGAISGIWVRLQPEMMRNWNTL